MQLEPINTSEFNSENFEIFNKNWFLLSAGTAADKFNCMTISWGTMGTMWNKPVLMVVVRPTRYTYGFMEFSPDFTVCAFPKEYRKALSLLGSKSGRDGDKVAESGLTPCPSTLVGSPSFAEANLIFKCRKIYTDAFKPQGFIDKSIEKEYPIKDYHHLYLGEVLAIRGDRALFVK